MKSIPNHNPYLRPTEQRITNWLAWSSTTGRFVGVSTQKPVAVTYRTHRSSTINYFNY